MRISAIVAHDRNRLIGTDAGLPWHLPRDLKRFREITWGKPILMGRRTHEQIGRPLPGRDNLVLTRRTDYAPPGVHVVHSVPEATATAEQLARQCGADEWFIIGGAEIYELFFPLVTRVYLTLVDDAFAGTVHFPCDLSGAAGWRVVRSEQFPADERNPVAHEFRLLERDPSG